MALTYHSARRGFLGFLTYLTGSDGVSRGGVIPAVTLTDSSGTEITSFGGGGAMTVADGANVAEGATTDAVVAAGAAGSISAKLRRLTTDIAAFATANHADLTAATPAGTNIIGKVSIDQTTPGTTNGTVPAGNVASGATDSGNPIKVGGVYNSTPPTLTTGQRGNMQLDVNGNQQVRLMMLGASIGDGVPAANVGLARDQANATNLMVATVQNIWNGASYDRLVKPNANSRLLSTAATTNATSVKASAANLFKITGNNTVAAKKYLKLYNKASAPTVGTDTPVMTLALLASSAFDISFTAGMFFGTGLAYAITAAAADADTTAIGAADIECINLSYA